VKIRRLTHILGLTAATAGIILCTLLPLDELEETLLKMALEGWPLGKVVAVQESNKMPQTRTIMSLLIPILLSLIVTPLSWSGVQHSSASYWHPASWNQEGRHPCAQPAAEQAAILREAQSEKYSLRRIEFIGNADTDDWTLRRRILLKEGNVFARAMLIKSLKSVNKIRTIYPVRLSDVIAHMDDQEKTIDVVICFREKKQLREE